MLPLPPVRTARDGALRGWLKRIDAYTLRTLNPRGPLGR
jgi:hypothetical protein